jgi:signal peptidase I
MPGNPSHAVPPPTPYPPLTREQADVEAVPPASRKRALAAVEEPEYEEVRDSWRETLETISFVVFLVLMLKAFVAEAYVIPTGSMAITLLGDHMNLECPRCHQKYTVNASNNGRGINQVQKENGQRAFQVEVCCPNCHYVQNELVNQQVDTGDKVLVLKPIYDLFKPARHDVVVFKYPGDARGSGPQEEFVAKNYIKRLWGLPGEKLAIWGGDVYLMVNNDNGGEKLEIIRKSPEKMLRMRRLVNDNDKLAPQFPQPWTTSWHPLSELLEKEPEGKTAWEPVNEGRSWAAKPKTEMSWLRYQHNFRPATLQGFAGQFPAVDGPHLITDFLAYNQSVRFPHDWVGDLMVDAEVEVQANTGKLVLQLNKGVYSAEAIFDLQSGQCRVQLNKQGRGMLQSEAKTNVHGLGKHLLRFANFDDRLTVWVDGKLPFGEGVELPNLPEAERGPRMADFLPAGIAVENAKVVVSHLSLWRDIYYSRYPGQTDVTLNSLDALTISAQEYKRQVEGEMQRSGERSAGAAAHQLKRAVWRPYYSPSVQVEGIGGSQSGPQYFPRVTPEHPSDRFHADEFFMMGDNSLESQDSRDWGQVPQRMLLGRAIWVYWPWNSFSSIR